MDVHTIIYLLHYKIRELENEVKRLENIKNPNECEKLMISYFTADLIYFKCRRDYYCQLISYKYICI